MPNYRTNNGQVKYRVGGQSKVKTQAAPNHEKYQATGYSGPIEPTQKVYFEENLRVSSSGTPESFFGTVSLAPPDSPVTVVAYVVPTGHAFGLMGFTANGYAHACYYLYVAGTVICTARTTPAELTAQMFLQANPITVSEGQSIVVKVANGASVSADFDATIFGYLY